MIALWLGHESIETTQIYLDADLALKEKALTKTSPMAKGKASGRYRPDDKLLAFLKACSGAPAYAESANYSRSCNGRQFRLPLHGWRFTRRNPELGIVSKRYALVCSIWGAMRC